MIKYRKLSKRQLERKLKKIRKEKEVGVTQTQKAHAIEHLEKDIEDRERMIGKEFSNFLHEIFEPISELQNAKEFLHGCKNADEYLEAEEKKVLKELAEIDTSKLN